MSAMAQNFQHYLTGAPILAFFAAFLAGVLASLTPCVYPMIPITAAYIGGRSAGVTKWRTLATSVSYVLGVSVMYSALGAVAALTGRIFGTIAASPYVNFFLAAVFVLLGLSMMDIFTIPTPGFLSNIGSKEKKGGLIGAFFLGLAAGLVATPCTTPVVLAILTLVAQRQNIIYGMGLLFSFSIGLSVLLVVVGIFAGSVAALPKSGEWMVKVKHIFGWLMVACAVYFIFKAVKIWI